ncbi:MAG: ABC transporter permease [Micromonosporaceae bacterium]|nr:ABC transporter permease [Micromonosporaceae bacterium]
MTTLVAPRVLRRSTLSRAGSVTARDLVATRNSGYWLVVFSGFFEPVLYLFSIGLGVGALVGEFRLADGRVIDYAGFVAPAMLAASAMNGALAETGFNFLARLKWMKLYDAMVATPLRPFEIALGELMWALARGSIYAVAFLGIMIALDLTTVGRAVPALAAALLIGLAFGGVGMAISTFMRSWQDFDYMTVAIFGLFLFSGTFAPADAYPEALRVIVALTPLYHGVELLRGFTTGTLSLAMAGHALYLVAMAAVGLAVAGRRMTDLLCR